VNVVPGMPARNTPPQVEKGVERLLSVQRPVVLLHIRSIRRRNPDASPSQVIKILETRYLAAVTAGGAAVGASSVIPGMGVGISLALSGVETAGFLETSALFAQSVTEVHGIAIEDPERARTLVMAMMLGTAGSDLVKQLAVQAAGIGPTRGRFWGELVTKTLPQAALGQIGDRIKKSFLKRFVATQSASAIGRTIPFGIGAVIGGTGNHLLGRKVVVSSRYAFGPAPLQFPVVLEPVVLEPVVLEPVVLEPLVDGPVVRPRRTRISLPRMGSGMPGSKTPKSPRPPKALRPPKQ
jgi:hypothetical protein